jgi:hypothetical protein
MTLLLAHRHQGSDLLADAIIAEECKAREALERLGKALTSPEARQLPQMYADAASTTTRLRTKVTVPSLPAGVDTILQAHERLLTSFNASCLLSNLLPNPAGLSGPHAVCSALHESSWRWAIMADALQPDHHRRTARVWHFAEEWMNQAFHMGPQAHEAAIAVARHLLQKVTDKMPAESDHLKRFVQCLVSRYSAEVRSRLPNVAQLREMLSQVLRGSSGSLVVYSPRLVNILEDILSSTSGLREQLLLCEPVAATQIDAATQSNGEGAPDASQLTARTLTAPTPQRRQRKSKSCLFSSGATAG